MSNEGIAEKVAEIVQPVCVERGLELVEVEFQPAGRRSLLRLTLDKTGGIGLDELAATSREVGDLLEAHDVVPGSYRLECSSPGINRPLKKPADFERYCGKRVRIATHEPVAGSRNFVGRLVATRETGIEIDDSSHGLLELDYAAIRRAFYEHDFSEELRGGRASDSRVEG
jgi:ribosome maturation factor RimP